MNKKLFNMSVEERLRWELEEEREMHRQDVESLSREIEFLIERGGDTSYLI